MSRLLPVVVLVLGAAPILSAQSNLPQRTRGSAQAPVTVYEMSDFQCPFCKRHSEQTFPLLEKEYIETGKVRWIFINYPLVSIHPNAVAAAEVAMCAANQGRFWDAHKIIFRTQRVWGPLKDPAPFLVTIVDSLRLEKPRALECLQRGDTRAEIQSDAEGSARAGATSTPAFYIEGGLMAGAQPIELFRRVLDSIYAVKTARR